MLSKLASLLFSKERRQMILGVGPVVQPSKDKIAVDAAKLVRYSRSEDYKMFEEETWARALDHLDKILDDKTRPEQIEFHRGSLKATLDLLRLAYQARETQVALEKEQAEAVSLAH